MPRTESSTGRLALLGGPAAIDRPLRRYRSIGEEEADAVAAVIRTGVLSQFLGAWHPDFYGGPQVKALERAAASYFGAAHALTVNSATSGLIAALGAIGLEPGDEVIVSPWTMSASATAVLHWNAIPVFADIEPDMFCLDPAAVAANISPYTRAIVAVDIFGQPADMTSLAELAARHGLALVSDTAQAPGARHADRFAGTVADVGVFSLNYHKHIHTGEGGIVVTNRADIADRVALIRNHGEAVVGPKGTADLGNVVGYNFRLGELECAIGVEQLKKLDRLIASRQHAANRLSDGLRRFHGLRLPVVRPDCSHVFYVYPLVLDPQALGVSRDMIVQALTAEGLPGVGRGYQNIHQLPMYQQRIAYGRGGFPWTLARRQIDYRRGICPVAEQLHEATFMSLPLCMFEFDDDEVDRVLMAFEKVWHNLPELASAAPTGGEVST